MTHDGIACRFCEKGYTLLREYGGLLTGLVVLQLIVYNYCFTTLIFTDHTFPNSWVSSYPSLETKGEGRWLADLIIWFQGGSGVQPFQMAVAASIQGVNGLLFARLLDLQRHLDVALFAAFLCLYPAFLGNYSFGIDHITFAIADSFALVGTLRLKCTEISAGNALVVAVFFILALAAVLLPLIPVGLRAAYIIQKTWEHAGKITSVNGYALLFFLWCGLPVVRLRMLIVRLLVVFLYFFVVVGTQESNVAALKTVYDLHMINRIASRIETEVSGLYTQAHALVVIGQYPAFPRQQYVRYADRGMRIQTQAEAFAPYRQTDILNYFFGRDVLRRPTPTSARAGPRYGRRTAAMAGTRPRYVTDDVVVVMLQEYRPDVGLTWTAEQMR